MLQKNRIYPVIVILAMFIVWQVRKRGQAELVSFTGSTMGTTYSIKYFEKEGINYKSQIDSILVEFNHSLSTYEPNSEISLFNQQSEFKFDRPYFLEVLRKSKEIYDATSGAFDPTVYPLVSAWGFGPDQRKLPDSLQVDSLMQYVGFAHIDNDVYSVKKDIPGVQLDFSAIAKGFGVDVVAAFLDDQMITDYFIEIGGEVLAKGKNKKNSWRVGIETPVVGERELMAVVELDDRAMATSGNYRNFYVIDGQRYAHTINPTTGYPVEHTLLSATVFGSSCMTADAFATACMVVGVEKAKILADQNDLDIFLIYSNPEGDYETFTSDGIKDKMKLN